MLRKLLRAKIHRATVTECDLDYVGSITIDSTLLEATGIEPNEAVSIYDIDNGARFETYVIAGEPGTGTIGVNGAAARLVAEGHKLIIACYGYLTSERIPEHEALIVIAGERNEIAETRRYPSRLPSGIPG